MRILPLSVSCLLLSGLVATSLWACGDDNDIPLSQLPLIPGTSTTAGGGGGGGGRGTGTVADTCDAVKQDCPGAGEVCVLVTTQIADKKSQTYATCKEQSSTIAAGAACKKKDKPCAGGLVCYQEVCRDICKVADNQGCTAPQTCQPGFPNSDWGYCKDPTPPAHPDACDAVTQDCTGANEACVLDIKDGTTFASCKAWSSTRLKGAECDESTKLCGKGLVCNGGVCRDICKRETNAGCTAPEECRIGFSGGVWGACQELPKECNPLVTNACGAKEACQPVKAYDGTWAMRCRPLGDATPAQDGEACGGGTRCEAGTVCADDGHCHKYCDAPADCASGQTCGGYFTVLPAVHYCK